MILEKIIFGNIEKIRGFVKEKIILYGEDPTKLKDVTTLYLVQKNDESTLVLGIDGRPLSPDVGDKIEVKYWDLGSVAKYFLEQKLGQSFNAVGRIIKQRPLKPEEAYQ